jgi:hypothetical protein
MQIVKTLQVDELKEVLCELENLVERVRESVEYRENRALVHAFSNTLSDARRILELLIDTLERPQKYTRRQVNR